MSLLFSKDQRIEPALRGIWITNQNGQLYGEELQIRYFIMNYSNISRKISDRFCKIHQKRPFILGLDRVLETTFTASAEAQIACWLGITKRLLNEKYVRNFERKKLLYQSDRLYQAIDPIIVMHLSRTAAELNVYETMMFYSFCFFSIVDEEIFYQYDLTEQKLPTAV